MKKNKNLVIGGTTVALLIAFLVWGLLVGCLLITPKKVSNLPTPIVDDFGMPMALIPDGPFQMGGDADVALAECEKFWPYCDRSWFEDAEPVHNVNLDDFYIDIYEVTNAQYKACVDDGVCSPPINEASKTRDKYYGNSAYGDYPVIYVSWYMADTFCNWRAARLPSEAEWEKAARGGLEGALYPWGDNFDGERANFCDRNCDKDWANDDYNDGYSDTAPVGSYSPNGYGLFDMAGNVWEYSSDWYDLYPGKEPFPEISGLLGQTHRVIRGGSWNSDINEVFVSDRMFDRGYPDINLGFRCARDP